MQILYYGRKTFAYLNNTPGELLHTCSLSHPKVVFTSYQTFDKFKRVAEQQKFIEKLFVFGSGHADDDNSFDKFLRNSQVQSNKRFYCPPQNMMDNISLVLCSSGTTGLPNNNVQNKVTSCSTM